MLEINDSNRTQMGAPTDMIENVKNYLNGHVKETMKSPPQQGPPPQAFHPQQGPPPQAFHPQQGPPPQAFHPQQGPPQDYVPPYDLQSNTGENVTEQNKDESNPSSLKLSILQICTLLFISCAVLLLPAEKILKNPNKFLLIFSKSLLICILFWCATLVIH